MWPSNNNPIINNEATLNKVEKSKIMSNAIQAELIIEEEYKF